MHNPGTLVFFCGKMASGKTTYATAYAAEHNAVLISEDDWLEALYPAQIHDFDDYLKFSALLRPLLRAHVSRVLRAGASVVMDFPANTARQRKWFVQTAENANAAHRMFHLQASDERCLRQLEQRRIQQPERAKFDTSETFHLVTSYFEPPTADERLNVELVVHESS